MGEGSEGNVQDSYGAFLAYRPDPLTNSYYSPTLSVHPPTAILSCITISILARGPQPRTKGSTTYGVFRKSSFGYPAHPPLSPDSHTTLSANHPANPVCHLPVDSVASTFSPKVLEVSSVGALLPRKPEATVDVNLHPNECATSCPSYPYGSLHT